MASSMNNWLGFSLSPQEIPTQHQEQNSLPPPHAFNNSSEEEISGATTEDQCFDLMTSHESTTHVVIPSLNLPPSFPFLDTFNNTTMPNNINHSQDWNYNKSSAEMSILMGSSCSNNQTTIVNHEPKLENFLGVAGAGNSYNDHHRQQQKLQGRCNNINNGGSGIGNNNNIGLSMIKNWLRNNPSTTPPLDPSEKNKNDGDAAAALHAVVGANNNSSNNLSSQNLSLSMSTGGGSQSNSALPLLKAAAASSDGDGGGESSTSENKQANGVVGLDGQSGAIEAVPRKSLDTFGQRTSIYRGVTRHRWTGRYEAHLWDNSCRREGQTRKGRQVYLGGYDKEEKAARAYDLAALKYWGTTTTTNFPISNYEKELEEMKHMTRQEYVASLRRKSSGFSRGASIYRGVTRHHQHGRWQARIGRVAGNKDLYLGTFSTQEEAAEAYDIAAIKFRGLNAVTNFEISRYDVKSILESSTLPIGGAAKRLKDAEHAAILALDAQRTTNDDHHGGGLSSHLSDGLNSYAWPSIAFQQAQPLSMHYPYGQQRLWCKQEIQDSEVINHSFQDLQQIHQLGNTHNFLQPSSVLHNLMSLDSSSMEMEHSSGSNSVIYSNGGNATYQGGTIGGYGGNSGFVMPMGNVSIADQEGNQNHQGNGFGENDQVKQNIGYENMFGSTDPYNQPRNLYYHSQQSSNNGAVKASLYDHGSSCNNWVPTAVPTLAARTSNVAVCHGASTFTVWNDT